MDWIPEELRRESKPTAQTFREWVKQSDLDARVRSDGLTASEREELMSANVCASTPEELSILAR